MKINMKEALQSQWDKEYDLFMAKHPGLPEPATLDKLDLVTQRSVAQQILAGGRPIEFRPMSEYYGKLLCDMKAVEYIERHNGDPVFREEVKLYYTPLRPVEWIHFHDRGNTWFLDVEVLDNSVCYATPEEAEEMKRDYGSTELYRIMEEENIAPGDPAPSFFTFALGEIIDTDLDVNADLF